MSLSRTTWTIWAYNRDSRELARAGVEVETHDGFLFGLSLVPEEGSSLPAAKSAGETLFRTVFGLRLELEQQAPWMLMVAAARYDAGDGTRDYPCLRQEVRYWPLRGAPSEPVHALQYMGDLRLLAMEAGETLLYARELHQGVPDWSKTFGAVRRNTMS